MSARHTRGLFGMKCIAICWIFNISNTDSFTQTIHLWYKEHSKWICVSFPFSIQYLIHMLYVYRFLWPIRLGWLLEEGHLQFFKCMSFWLHGCFGEWEGWARKLVNHISWLAVVTPTDRPKSVHNCYVIELYCGVVCVVTLRFGHFCWCRCFCNRTESELFLLISKKFSAYFH